MKKELFKVFYSVDWKDWCKWQAKCIAKAQLKGFKTLLTGDETVPQHDIAVDVTTAKGKKSQRLLEANAVGYNSLILAIETEVCLQLCKDQSAEINLMDVCMQLSRKAVPEV